MARKPLPAGTPAPTSLGHIVELIRDTVPPMHRAGAPFVAAPLAVAALFGKRRAIRTPALVGAAAVGAFFRNPTRVPPLRTDVVVAAADGTVALVDRAVPPAELDLGTEPLPRVSVFLSILDVHVQRVPVAGTARVVRHTPGRFLSADLPEASEVNERTGMTIRTPGGLDVAVVQIAGLIARRIVNEVQPGAQLELGSTYGLIRFGSRVDIYLPEGSRPAVRVGQRTIGAETVIAELP